CSWSRFSRSWASMYSGCFTTAFTPPSSSLFAKALLSSMTTSRTRSMSRTISIASSMFVRAGALMSTVTVGSSDRRACSMSSWTAVSTGSSMSEWRMDSSAMATASLSSIADLLSGLDALDGDGDLDLPVVVDLADDRGGGFALGALSVEGVQEAGDFVLEDGVRLGAGVFGAHVYDYSMVESRHDREERPTDTRAGGRDPGREAHYRPDVACSPGRPAVHPCRPPHRPLQRRRSAGVARVARTAPQWVTGI